MKVLAVEDDDLLLEFIVRCLQKHEIEVDTAVDGNLGYRKAKRVSYDVLIFDINLPSMLGTEICEKIREEDIHTPVLFLSANDSKDDKVQGLELGADDYLVKPFDYEELVARVKALARRPSNIVPSTISYEDLHINTARREATYKGNSIRLTPKEFQLLEILARNPETVLSREYLLKYIWGVTPGNTSNRLEVCIRGLRLKLSSALGGDLISTEYGVGYRLAK